MKLKTRKLVMDTLVGFIAVAIAGLAVARIFPLVVGGTFIVEDRISGADSFVVKDQGQGVEVPRGPLELKDKTSGGQVKFYEGSGGGSDSVTVKSPDALDADVIYTLPAADGTAAQILQTDGKGVLSWVDQATGGGTAACGSEAVVDVVVPFANGGRAWMDRNLGASRRATSIDDALAFGSLFQWGRGRDGHECSQATYKGPVTDAGMSANNPWEGKFIIVPVKETPRPWSWSSPVNDTLWGDGKRKGITKGLNDPCPAGYQVPNQNELTALGIKNTSDAFDILKLPAGGVRIFHGSGTIIKRGNSGFYWSSVGSFEGNNGNGLLYRPLYMVIGDNGARMKAAVRLLYVEEGKTKVTYVLSSANGLSVRCIKSL